MALLLALWRYMEQRLKATNHAYWSVLTLTAKEGRPMEWVLPKGHIEAGEDGRETAVREVVEETGVWARIVGDLKTATYTVGDKTITVQFYLMQYQGRGMKKDPDRHHQWLLFSEAVNTATHAESKALLGAAEQLRNRL